MRWLGECCGDECLELGQEVCSEWLRLNDPVKPTTQTEETNGL